MNIVYVATTTIGERTATGHFLTADDIPEGWTPADPPTKDITNVMNGFDCSKERALQMLNAHWQG